MTCSIAFRCVCFTADRHANSQIHIQRRCHLPRHRRQCLFIASVAHMNRNPCRLRHHRCRRTDFRNHALRIHTDQPAADIQTTSGRRLTILKQDDIGCTAADIQIRHPAMMVHAVLPGTAAFTCNQGFHIRSRCRNNKISGKIRQTLQHRIRILLPCRLTGDDHCTTVRILRPVTGLTKFGSHNVPKGLGIDQHICLQRRHVDFTLIDHFFVNNGHPRHREISAGIVHLQLAKNHLGGGSAHIDANA